MGATVIAIPTFRRPALLARLLDGLIPQAKAEGAAILIGDNDCDDAVRALVESRGGEVPLRYVPVPTRGVSQVRNALVAAADEMAPDWRWLLMLDDDGMVTPGWLRTIVACGDRYKAALVGGPVEGMLPESASALARNSVIAGRRRAPTGPVAQLHTTQNLCVSRQLVNRLRRPLFDDRYGASGGEDYDLFRRTVRAGGALVWCDEAVILEPPPSERLTTRALLYRAYSTGAYMSPIDCRYDGMLKVCVGVTKGLIRGILEISGGAVAHRPDLAAQGILRVSHYLGRMSGLLGLRSARYAAAEK